MSLRYRILTLFGSSSVRMRGYHSRVNTHDYYINSTYAINSVSLSFLSPFKYTAFYLYT